MTPEIQQSEREREREKATEIEASTNIEAKKDNVPRAAINRGGSSIIGHSGASAGPQRGSASGILRRSITRCVVASRHGVDGGSHQA